MGAGILVVVGLIALAVLALGLVLRNMIYICAPSEVLIFSGRNRTDAEGRELGYRVIKGGRALRIPLLETVDRLDLTNMIIEITVRNAYSRGGIPLTVQGVANIKLPGEGALIHYALERFLGRTREQIMQVARETLEGNLRGVLATLTPEQVNEDKEAFAHKLTEEAEHDLNKIGLVLDTLKIQNVSDEVGYLDAIGRMRSAHIRRNASVAEAEAQASAAEVKWEQFQQGELHKIEAAIQISRKENDRRIADAQTRRGAMIAEQRATVQAAIAQAEAELQMQEARIEQVTLQLQADVVRPATARKEQAIAQARAAAVKTIEQGKASAKVLEDLAATYRDSAGAGREVLLMQKLLPILRQVSGTIGKLKVKQLTVIGPSNANGASASGESLAAKLMTTSEQIRAATGVDLPAAIRNRLGQGSSGE
ncbi:MAG: SPFH domain-containing protein [Myxococcales bacterium]|nr:SPFH domain-containing protein [Myxococcales bacterium]